MRQLTSVLIDQIEKQIKSHKTIIIRVECIDNPIIYWHLCDYFRNSSKIDIFIAKLAQEKYYEFSASNNPEWVSSLQSLHQGANPYHANDVLAQYAEKSYVDFNNAITKWRNESANLGKDTTALVLLMGTEAAPDTGGLADTSYAISPREIIANLSANYCSWFTGVLIKNGINPDDCSKAVHTLYRVIFSNTNIDIFKLSSFVDQLEAIEFSTGQDLVNYICETLNVTWGIPSIIGKRSVPKISSLSQGKLSSGKIIEQTSRPRINARKKNKNLLNM